MSSEGQRPTDPGRNAGSVLLLNHRRDPAADLCASLRDAGYPAVQCVSLRESADALAAAVAAGTPPAVVILNPLSLQAGGVEAEMLADLQRTPEPVAVIVLVDDIRQLHEARKLSLSISDFMVRPFPVEELVHRVECVVRNREALRRVLQRTRDLEGQVSVDFKTGLLSERHFKSVLQAEFNRAQRHRLPLSLALVDVDEFKRVNDSTEYAFGDEVLRAVAAVLKESTRQSDFAARFGGDEFVLLLPHTPAPEAVQTALRVRKKIAQTVVRSASYSHQVTVSIGIDSYDGTANFGPDELRRRANKALQEAKRRGRNQVWLYSECTVEPAGS